VSKSYRASVSGFTSTVHGAPTAAVVHPVSVLADGFFAWNDDDLTGAQWVAAGQDTNGTFSSP
jgi:hypothetical protein